jgi:large subunit ribosomal protein L10
VLRSEKQASIEYISRIYRENNTVILAHYHGLTVNTLQALRKELRKAKAGLKIVKNTLARRAAATANIDPKVLEIFKGPICIAYADDPISFSKTIVNFAKDNVKLKIIGGTINNTYATDTTIQEYANLPPLDQARARIIGLLTSPASRVIRLLQARAESLSYSTPDIEISGSESSSS